MRVLGVSGSLRRDSYNTRLLWAAGEIVEQRGAEFEVWSARPARLSVMTVWTRRCCAPSCRSRTTRRRSSSAAATIRARDAARSTAPGRSRSPWRPAP